jgi:hypothetical protein
MTPPNLRTAACCGSCRHSDWEKTNNCTLHHAFEPNPDPDGEDVGKEVTT